MTNPFGNAYDQVLALVRERDELRAEVKRLQTGIKSLIVEYDDERDLMHPDYNSGLAMASDDLADLLNPTEGDPDE